jgi:carbonic anhydrase
MTHFHDSDIKKALLEIAPDERKLIEDTEFGEIKNRLVLSCGIKISSIKF